MNGYGEPGRDITRVPLFQKHMQYPDQEGKVVYTSKDGRTSKSFPALERLTAVCYHLSLLVDSIYDFPSH